MSEELPEGVRSALACMKHVAALELPKHGQTVNCEGCEVHCILDERLKTIGKWEEALDGSI